MNILACSLPFPEDFLQDKKACYQAIFAAKQDIATRQPDAKLHESELKNVVEFFNSSAQPLSKMLLWLAINHSNAVLLQVHPHVETIVLDLARNPDQETDEFFKIFRGKEPVEWLQAHGYLD